MGLLSNLKTLVTNPTAPLEVFMPDPVKRVVKAVTPDPINLLVHNLNPVDQAKSLLNPVPLPIQNVLHALPRSTENAVMKVLNPFDQVVKTLVPNNKLVQTVLNPSTLLDKINPANRMLDPNANSTYQNLQHIPEETQEAKIPYQQITNFIEPASNNQKFDPNQYITNSNTGVVPPKIDLPELPESHTLDTKKLMLYGAIALAGIVLWKKVL